MEEMAFVGWQKRPMEKKMATEHEKKLAEAQKKLAEAQAEVDRLLLMQQAYGTLQKVIQMIETLQEPVPEKDTWKKEQVQQDLRSLGKEIVAAAAFFLPIFRQELKLMIPEFKPMTEDENSGSAS